MTEFFRNWIRYILVFIAIIIVSVALNYYFVIREFRPLYESKASIFVGMSPKTAEVVDTYEMLQSVQISEKLVFDIPEVIYGSTVLDAVNNALSENSPGFVPVNLKDFKEFVSTGIVTNTRVVNITVEAYDPAQAQMIAKIITESTDTAVGKIIKQDYIHVIKEAEYPTSTTGLSKTALWILSVVGGMLIGFMVILIITVVQRNSKPKKF